MNTNDSKNNTYELKTAASSEVDQDSSKNDIREAKRIKNGQSRTSTLSVKVKFHSKIAIKIRSIIKNKLRLQNEISAKDFLRQNIPQIVERHIATYIDELSFPTNQTSIEEQASTEITDEQV